MKTRLAALAAVTLLTASCGNLLEPAAAVVDGSKITIDKVQEELDRFRDTARYQDLTASAPAGQIDRDFEQTQLSLLIREEVLEGEAEERDIEVTPEEVTERIDAIKEQIGSEGAFQEALKEEGLTVQQLEFQVRVQLLEEKLRAEVTKDAAPAEAELRSYYESHLGDYQEVKAQHILVSKEGLAARLMDQLQSAKPDRVDDLFASLAKRFSEDPSNAGKGGDLGWAAPSDYVPPFAKAVSNLDVGAISPPVQTEFGFHVIRVTGRRVTPFGQAREDIEERIGGNAVEEAFQEWLVDAYKEADIKVNPKFGVLRLESQSIENPTAEDVPAGVSPAPSGEPAP